MDDARARGRRLLVFTGAGLSADSGLSTFRDGGGLWEGHAVERVASMEGWRRNADAVHAFYNERRSAAVAAQPNPGHRLLAGWQSRYGATLVTQNVDDLMERAGCRDVVHVHGTLSSMLCTGCGTRFEIGTRKWTHGVDRCPLERCRSRRGVKPGVVFFDERAPLYLRLRAEFATLADDDVLVVIGTTGLVVDVGSVARRTRATTVLSNLETRIEERGVRDEQFDHVIHGRIAATAPALDDLVSRLMAG